MAFWRLNYHIVWATYDRQHWITDEIEQELFRYIKDKATKELGLYIHAMNGWYDHMHIVATSPPKHAISDVVKRLKGASAHHINHHGAQRPYTFAWQRGYGVLSLGEQQKASAIEYVERQKEHHNNQTQNHWLEHCTEQDEGPPILQESSDAKVLREPPTEYGFRRDPFF